MMVGRDTFKQLSLICFFSNVPSLGNTITLYARRRISTAVALFALLHESARAR